VSFEPGTAGFAWTGKALAACERFGLAHALHVAEQAICVSV
jgi:hypothetical protein